MNIKYLCCVLLLMLITQHGHIQACGACGCQPMMFQSAVKPYDKTHAAGIMYGLRSFYGNSSELEGAEEFKHTGIVFAHYFLTEQFKITAEFPFSYNLHSGPGHATEHFYGPGDPRLLFSYVFYHGGDSMFNIPRQNRFFGSLDVGFGIQFPLGRHTQESSIGFPEPLMQAGYGSWAALFRSSYSLLYNQFGWRNAVQMNVSGENSLGFNYGNQFQFSSTLFIRYALGEFNFVSHFGVLQEKIGKNRIDGLIYEASEGYSILHMNVEKSIFFNRLGLNAGLNIPVHQQSGPISLQNRLNFNAGLQYFF